ncbi:hypothetical protein L596_007233 [Steinernema carpocapsae]|uniref:Cytochrome b561 domain-containing protein n=1 Tax=Steinernema carpocapsae TaxID=34508 RepID=A0A4U5P9C0_STECR|nr:hypothetical protein L596_007233 [Steinernema carpocapsae]
MEFRSSQVLLPSVLFAVLMAAKPSEQLSDETPKTSSLISHEQKWLLTKIHGIAFIFAWFLFVPVAVGGARYCKNYLTQYTPMGLRVWYHAHRTLNLIAVALMIVGLTTIFIAHEWRWLGPQIGGKKNTSATAYHTMFGILSVLLAWIQPFNSLFRCNPSHRLRSLFNWSHRLLGLTSLVFASAAIFIACVYFYKHLTSTTNAIIFCSLCIGVILGTVVFMELIAWKNRSVEESLLAELESDKHLYSTIATNYH